MSSTGIEQAAPGNGLGCFSNSRASDLILPKVNGSRSLVLGSRLLETNRRAYLQSGSPPAPWVFTAFSAIPLVAFYQSLIMRYMMGGISPRFIQYARVPARSRCFEYCDQECRHYDQSNQQRGSVAGPVSVEV